MQREYNGIVVPLVQIIGSAFPYFYFPGTVLTHRNEPLEVAEFQ